MEKSPQGVLTAAFARILRPLVRILLKNGISYRTFADIAKSQFVEMAQKEFAIEIDRNITGERESQDPFYDYYCANVPEPEAENLRE